MLNYDSTSFDPILPVCINTRYRTAFICYVKSMFTLITNHHAASMRALTCFILIQSDAPNSLVIGLVVNAVAMFFPDHYRLRNGYCYSLAQISLRLTQTPLTTRIVRGSFDAKQMQWSDASPAVGVKNPNTETTHHDNPNPQATKELVIMVMGLTRPANLQTPILMSFAA